MPTNVATVVVGARGATAAAVTAADGRVTVAELIEITVHINGVPADQHGRGKVGRDEHVRAVRRRDGQSWCVSFERDFFRIFGGRRNFLPSPVRYFEDGRGHAALVAAVLDGARERVMDSLLAVQLEQWVQNFYSEKINPKMFFAPPLRNDDDKPYSDISPYEVI